MVVSAQCACRLFLAVALLLGCCYSGEAFSAPLRTTTSRRLPPQNIRLFVRTHHSLSWQGGTSSSLLHATRRRNNPKDDDSPRFFQRLCQFVPATKRRGKRLLRKAKPISFAILTVLSLSRMGSSSSSSNVFCTITRPAHASAPLPAMPQMQEDDLEGEALKQKHNVDMAEYQKEMQEFQAKAQEIQAKQGDEARAQFEQDYKQAKQDQARAKSAQVEQLKRALYDQGISPVYDIEGERQVTLLEKGVDLAEIPGTRFYAEKTNQVRFPDRSEAYQKKAHRFILKEKVLDLKRRGVDPLKHFEATKEDARILDMPSRKALALQRQYMENLVKYGQITVPVKGETIMTKEELAAKMEAEAQATGSVSKLDAKAKAKEEKAKLKAKAKEEKAAARALAKEEKAKLREEKAKAKEEARAAKAAATAAAAAAAGTAAAQGVGKTVSAGVDAVSSELGSSTAAPPSIVGEKSSAAETQLSAPVDETTDAGDKDKMVSSQKKSSGSKVPVVPVATFVATVGGGGYAFKVYQEKTAAAEAERQRQFKLLMGQDTDDDDDGPSWSAPALEVDQTDAPSSSSTTKPPSSSTSAAPSESPVVEQPKKRKRGIKSVFSKKSNGRETDLFKLVGPTGKAPEFASLLAKVLSLGAPGRFPQVETLPGGMPMEEFDLNATKELLEESMASADLENKDAAEVFADVANCMMIDIVDLASSALKERNDKMTVSAINVVIDFMNHAADIFLATLEDTEITPVTYGGTLGKGKLEQMYRKYAESAQSPDSLQLLKDVFEISDKKAQGIEQKIMMKQMMDMMKGMKDGEVPPEMAEMMESMGGLGGLEGLANMEGIEDMEVDFEQLKTMLQGVLDMKKAGLLPEDELKKMQAEVKTLLEGLKAEAESLSPEEKEVEELMNKIFSD